MSFLSLRITDQIHMHLDASREVIRNNSESQKALDLDKQLTKNITTPERPIEVVVSPDRQVEIAALVEKIQ